MIYSIIEACEFILEDQCEPQSPFWLASQITEMKLWRATEVGVRNALNADINKWAEKSQFVKVGDDAFGLRSWDDS